MIDIAVFVNSIDEKSSGMVVVEAANGSKEGPPFVRFTTPNHDGQGVTIGKRYRLRLEEWPHGQQLRP